MILTGNTLGERQKQLNFLVNDAASNSVPFDQVKEKSEENDVDKLFKIDLAGKYKNVAYIIEVLKCGDSLYISRAIKSTFLYDEEFANIINPEYLHDNVFPSMSRKMKYKLLSTIATNIRNELRAEAFYQYCVKENLVKFTTKFLIFASDDFKLDILKNNLNAFQSAFNYSDSDDITVFIGNNTTLATLYLKVPFASRGYRLFQLRHFYSINPELYLSWVEEKAGEEFQYGTRLGHTLGLRISKDIVKNHKNRILKHIELYINLVNKNTLAKYSSVEEAKQYLIALLPKKAQNFWNIDFCIKYKFILDIIPFGERYNFMKTIFSDKYLNQQFEMSSHFNTLKYYKFMTVKQRESWALRILDTQAEKDYEYYRFIKYDKAFAAIKKLLYITPDAKKRSAMIQVLVQSAKNQHDLENLLKYYYEKHVNETRFLKESFLIKVIEIHNVFEFRESCWIAFDKLLYSLDIYHIEHSYSYNSRLFLQTSLIYHIINDKELSEGLKKYARSNDISLRLLEENLNKLDEVKNDVVCRYLLDIMVNKLKELEGKPYEIIIKNHGSDIIHVYDEIKKLRKLSEDEPAIVTSFKSLLNPGDDTKNNKVNETNLLKILKEDAFKITSDPIIAKIKYSIDKSYEFKVKMFLNKLKVYFPNDLTQEYLNFFTELLSDSDSQRVINSAVFGIFILATEAHKSEFIAKHAPKVGKIEYSKINSDLLSIQEAICRFVGYPRPPIPLSDILQYIKGDYVHYCLPIFNMYQANLPLPKLFKFVEALLDTAVSIQKHALRLAFHCFNAEELRTLILKTWNSTKNLSLRFIIYTSLINDIVGRHSDKARQAEMFELLLVLTLDLNKDDHPDVIHVLTSASRIPENFCGRYLETAWKTLSKFPNEGSVNLKRRGLALRNLKMNIEVIDKAMIRDIIDEYFNTVLSKEYIAHSSMGEVLFEGVDNSRHLFSDLNQAKFELAVAYITKCNDGEGYRVHYVNLVLDRCLELWNVTYGDSFIFRDFCQRFICHIIDQNYESGKPSIAMNVIFEKILQRLQDSLPSHEIYMITWNLRLSIIINVILDNIKQVKDRCPRDLERELARNYAKKVNDLVIEYVEKKEFYWSMLDEIADEVKNNMNRMTDALVYFPGICTLLQRNVEAHTVLELSKINPNRIETAVLAVKLIPSFKTSLTDTNEVLADIYKNLKKFGSPEVQTFLYKRFVKNGFKN